MSRRSRALALAGLSLTLLTATGCAKAGVSVRPQEAANTDLPANGIVRFVYPHVTASAPGGVAYPQVLNK